MIKSNVIYECTNCGSQSAKWAGQCGECGKWNTLSETVVSGKISNRKFSNSQIKGKLLGLDEVEGKVGERQSTKIAELDRVLGGGLVAGEVVLMVGEPGIGKSTLLTQLALNMGNENPKSKTPNNKQIKNSNKLNSKEFDALDFEFGASTRSVVYVCGEESPGQVKIRVNRMGGEKRGLNLKMLAEMDVDVIISTIEKNETSLLIIDSVQTLYTSDLPGLAGSVSQIRECTGRVIAYAKSKNVPVILVGHVTKDGEMAGPKVLEHMVDAVLELTGDRYYDLRLLRTQKNRFGATDEVGVFRMSEAGMEEVVNPSEMFLSEREEGSVGSCVAVVMEGTRPVMLEVQALVVNSELPVPRRVSQGVDVRRVQILLGVLQKYTKLSIGTKDVFVKITGGLTVKEPAIDLAIILAVASSASGRALPKNSCAIGEVGLLGEVRNVSMYEKRVKEANKLGYNVIYSKNSSRKISQLIREISD
jgi:DNA repair protein RadA/Sms